MRNSTEALQKHYASLSDDSLLAIDREELTQAAQECYDEELARRNLVEGAEDEGQAGADGGAAPAYLQDEGGDEDDWEVDAPAPEWLEDAACACAFAVHPGTPYVDNVTKARAALRGARIPCHIVSNNLERTGADAPPQTECCVMVPGALTLHAAAVLDRDVFNAEHEADWRAHLEALSDGELRALDPDVFCAGLLDRVARLKKVFANEIARRGVEG